MNKLLYILVSHSFFYTMLKHISNRCFRFSVYFKHARIFVPPRRAVC
uniref:Uncharacterized protein n=1 Tax=Anopheles minimus TaxID=112268 RepID=A0A182WP84_9DIPT